ncbi:MAG: hypothetical protein ACXADA_16540 [Candidatus Hodarchaeales archaeon]
MPRRKLSYMKFLSSGWEEQSQAFKQYVNEANEAIKEKNYEEAEEIINLLIDGTFDYLKADIEDTGRVDRHHQSFIRQLVDLHLVKDNVFTLQEKRIKSFQSMIDSFALLKDQDLFKEVVSFCQELVKNLDRTDPKNEKENYAYLFLINTFGLYCLEFQFKEAEFFFDLALDILSKTALPFTDTFFKCYIGRALIHESNQKFNAALEIYKQFLDHIVETIEKQADWWKGETSERLMLLKEAFFYTFVYAFYCEDEKTISKAYLNFPLLEDKTMTSRLIHVIMTCSEARLLLQDVLVEAETFEDIYKIFDQVYQNSNIQGWKDRRVELKHPDAKVFLPRIMNRIMEGKKPKYGILLIESTKRMTSDQINFNLGEETLKEILIQIGEKHKYVELGGITFTVENNAVQAFASTLEPKKINELNVKYRYWPEYKVKLSLSDSGLVKYKLEDLVRRLKLQDGGIEHVGRIWSRSETLTDTVRAIGKLPKKTFNFKYEQQYRQFCKELSNVLKKIGKKNFSKAMSELSKQEYMHGESVRLVIIQRFSEAAIKMGLPPAEIESVTKDIILKKI